jgi:hypothetical protein
MSRRTVVLLIASAIFGIASVATTSADALPAKKAVHRRAAPVVAVAPAAPAVVIDNNYGPVAERIPKCIDSVIFYPYPPCY